MAVYNYDRGGLELELVDARRGRNTVSIKAHINSPNAIAFSQDERFLAIGEREKTVLLWDLRNMHILRRLGTIDINSHSPVSSVSFSNDGSRLLATFANDWAVIWKIPSGAQQALLFLRVQTIEPPSIVTASLDDGRNLVIVVRSDGSVQKYSIARHRWLDGAPAKPSITQNAHETIGQAASRAVENLKGHILFNDVVRVVAERKSPDLVAVELSHPYEVRESSGKVIDDGVRCRAEVASKIVRTKWVLSKAPLPSTSGRLAPETSLAVEQSIRQGVAAAVRHLYRSADYRLAFEVDARLHSQGVSLLVTEVPIQPDSAVSILVGRDGRILNIVRQ